MSEREHFNGITNGDCRHFWNGVRTFRKLSTEGLDSLNNHRERVPSNQEQQNLGRMLEGLGVTMTSLRSRRQKDLSERRKRELRRIKFFASGLIAGAFERNTDLALRARAMVDSNLPSGRKKRRRQHQG